MDNEPKNKKSNVIAWIRWAVDVVVWLAENWETLPKPPTNRPTDENKAN